MVENRTHRLMLLLAKWANIELSFCKRMVLVLDVDDIPRIFTETFLPFVEEETLTQLEDCLSDAEVAVHPNVTVPVSTTLLQERAGTKVVDTSSMLNETIRTKTCVDPQ